MAFFYLKVKKIHVPKMLFLFFAKTLPAIFFGAGEFLSNLKPNSQRSLGPIYTLPFPGGVMGNFFEKNHRLIPNWVFEIMKNISHACVSLMKETGVSDGSID
jgi:hypothetical protein